MPDDPRRPLPLLTGAILMLGALAAPACSAPRPADSNRQDTTTRLGTVAQPGSVAQPDTTPQPVGPPIRPDPRLTPGAVLPVTAKDICVPGYTKKVRNVPAAVKRKVYAAYGIAHRAPGEYEVDHLISLELGGSNAIANLWPESYRTKPWNARVKDALENHLHREVCAGTIRLRDAQREIATDWIASYQRHFHRKLPK
jgi:hypothetical protein